MDNRRIEWTRVEPRHRAARAIVLTEAAAGDAAPMQAVVAKATPLEAALAAVGLPSVGGAASPKEDAVGLLMLAAEVEHALMAQYLYAAQSLRGAAGRTIARVAIQEMGHLVTVQNLLLLLNGLTAEGLPAKLHFGRDGLRRNGARNPLPLVFEPVSRMALAKFVVVERPGRIDDPALAARIANLEAELDAAGVSPNPVFALYAAIHWLFQPDDTPSESGSVAMGFAAGWHLRDADFVDPNTIVDHAAEPLEWGAVPGLIVAPVRDRTGALTALKDIAAQGEGLFGTAESHFRNFLDLLTQFEAHPPVVAGLPRTPYVPSQPLPEDPQATPLVNRYTVLWAELFNCSYELLIIDLAWALSQPRGAARTALVDSCIETMSHLIKSLSGYLAKRPRGADPVEIAGPTYGLSDTALPITRADYKARYAVLLADSTRLVDAVRADPEFQDDFAGEQILKSISEIENQRRPYLP